MTIRAHGFLISCTFSIALLGATASAQSVLFDFNNAPNHTSLPIDLTAGGITAHFSATGQGFSIQDMSSPVVPIGFTGRFLYPNSVFAADLLVSFDQTLTTFSIRYAPQELACDDSARMRVTASSNGTVVGSVTHSNPNPGTYPVDTLSCSFPQGFDSVVVHYDAPPPTCTDYGPIFLCDDLRVTPRVSVGSTFCRGDGSGLACPCGNTGAAGHGCANSSFSSGALLSATGPASVVGDAVQLTATSLTGASCVFFQGSAQMSPVIVDDGIGCVSGTIVRLGTKGVGAGASAFPQAGDPLISVRGALPAAGGTYSYQCFYRNAASAFCPPATSNRTNGVQLIWAP